MNHRSHRQEPSALFKDSPRALPPVPLGLIQAEMVMVVKLQVVQAPCNVGDVHVVGCTVEREGIGTHSSGRPSGTIPSALRGRIP